MAYEYGNVYISLVKVRFARSLPNLQEAHKAVRTMDNLIFPESKFYVRSNSEVGLWFGGQFRELQSPIILAMADIFIFGGPKYTI